MIKATRLRNGARFRLVTVAAAVAGAVAALATPALASTSAANTSAGYPPPGGIYKPFTNCPLNNPYMHEDEVGNFGGAACIAATAPSGTITLGNITTPVTEAVHVQFAFASNPGFTNYPLPAYPPLAGPSAILKTKPDVIPGTLTDALSCATATDATIQNLCQQLVTHPEYNTVTALAQEAGNLRNFNLFDWVQPVKFKLINPLLGSNCYIGSDENPVVLHPSLSLGPGGSLTGAQDPEPTLHPDTLVLALTGAVASDSSFSAPGVLGCGPGGSADVAVDEALDAGAGLPAASGNSLTLNGSFLVAAN
ncbi:MAG: hypothetical protein J2P17_20565, partial [Mycobacterium sp.]|nr:hypothetical protein [Mycobacterium sp.]